MAGQQPARVIVVTGAARGIGQAIAARFAADGEYVVLTDIDPQVEAVADDLCALGGSASATVTDVADEAGASAIVARTVEGLGRLDVLVNNAAVHGAKGPIAAVSVEDWDRVLAVNLRSAFLMSKAALPALARARGAIVNLASIVGPIIGSVVSLPYGASKAGMVGLTHNLALQAAPFGVRVNCVCPGSIDTELTRRSFAAIADERSGDPQAVTAAFAAGIPLNRLGSAPEVAATVRFLASAEASYITGAAIVVDGGLSIR